MIIPKFSLILRVFQSSRKFCFAIASNVPGISIPAFYCSHIDKKKVFQAASLLSGRLLYVAVFPRVLRGGEEKIAVIEEFFSSVLWVFYYPLTLSRSDFANCRTHLARILQNKIGLYKKLLYYIVFFKRSLYPLLLPFNSFMGGGGQYYVLLLACSLTSRRDVFP